MTPKHLADKVQSILVCPVCHGPLQIDNAGQTLLCRPCARGYPRVGASWLLLPAEHPLFGLYANGGPPPAPRSWKGRLRSLIPSPEERVWTRRSRQAIARVLRGADPDHPDHVVVNLGAGLERVFQQNLAPYHSLIRFGLPHSGHVDVIADAQQLPFRDASIDLMLSSSVLEHVENPEQAVAEMARVLRPGGRVYSEIPFLRAYHMAPHDYQRYTISGIAVLFGRHGLRCEDKGICSGPFTAWALLFRDSIFILTPTRPLKMAVRTLLSWLVHPIKYLDWLCEDATWATHFACNFYYVGRKNTT
ncbi:MAG: methyltransferase domain-containing protein [Chloroflexi bacterium]|nr:methyltransferase domain-containing protein [Chloroflexota bacterium]